MGGSVIDLLDGTEDHRRGALDRPAHQVPWAVAAMYFGEPLLDRHELAVWAGGHVTEGKHARKRVRRGLELAAQEARPRDCSGSVPALGDDATAASHPTRHGAARA